MMNRKAFLNSLAWISGGLIISRCSPARGNLLIGDKRLTGTVTGNGVGLKDVVVSDGYSVVLTDKKGAYTFEKHPDAVAIFVSVPAGYHFLHERNITRNYRLLNGSPMSEINFQLTKLDEDDTEHDFFIWADPQVKNASDVSKMMEQSVPDMKQAIAQYASGSLLHGITVGDIVWDALPLFADYDKAVDKMGIPFFQCLGNHDMDYRKGGDETSDDTFQQTYGPTYYSFNRGQVHYVVMDNVRYLGTERDYDGYVQQNQLDWLQKDLSFVGKDKLIVLCLHIPVHSGTKNKEALYSILSDRTVHIMSGHTHYNVNKLDGNIFEHNHGTVCGAWWTGAICEDGTPNGYGVYKVNGTELSWHYKATGKTADHQMKIHLKDFNGTQKQAVVNIWNADPAWNTQYWVDGVSKGSLEQFEGLDPDAYATMLGPNLPSPRGFAEPKNTRHLFKALLPVGARELKVQATDRFGRTYTEVERITG